MSVSLPDLHRRIQVELRRDLGRAAHLVAQYERVAAQEGKPLGRAMARFERAQLDHVAGRLLKALRGYADARGRFARLGARRELVAADLGAIQIHSARGEARKVAGIARRLRSGSGDPVLAAGSEIAIARAYDGLGDEHAAEKSYERALRRLGRRRKPAAVDLLRAVARQNLGICLVRRGAVARGLRELESALALFLERGMHETVDKVRLTRAWAIGIAGNTLEALRELGEVREAFVARGDLVHAALAQIDEAEICVRLGDFEQAGKLARRAAQRLRRRQSPLDAARADLLAARAAKAAGRGGAARRTAERARQEFLRAGDQAGVALASVILERDLAAAERTLCRTGHWIAGLDALVVRARVLAGGAGARLLERRAKSYPETLRRRLLPDLYRLRAEGRADRIPMLRRAFRAAEDLRCRAPTGSLRATALAAHLEIYHALARALLDRGRSSDRREAFLVLDAARARTLREDLEREAPGVMDRPSIRRLRDRLELLWRALERRESETNDLRTANVSLFREAAACERELVQSLRRAETAGASRPAAVSLPREPCLSLAILDGDIVALLCMDGDVHTWAVGSLASLVQELEVLRFQVTRRLFGAEDDEAAVACLDMIAAKIFGPAPPLDMRHLTVVLPPDIGHLPIEALPYRGEPLLERMVVTHAPYACLSGARWRRGGRSLVVGIESNELPEVAREIASVAGQLREPEVLAGDAASREAVLSSLAGKRLIHIAGHASARDDIPLLCALRVRDGWVTAADLPPDLSGALVVLSACRTADPALLWRGEGMGGFPRGLLAAGAAGIVASRWEVRDEIAYLWMQLFYEGLSRVAPAEALAQAARQVRRLYPHPADWAAFLTIRGIAAGG